MTSTLPASTIRTCASRTSAAASSTPPTARRTTSPPAAAAGEAPVRPRPLRVRPLRRRDRRRPRVDPAPSRRSPSWLALVGRRPSSLTCERGWSDDPVCRGGRRHRAALGHPASSTSRRSCTRWRMDLTVTEYHTYDDLYEYVYGSAAVIGLQMVPILGADLTRGVRPRQRISASPSSSPTSSATSARTSIAVASTCRWTSSRRSASPAPTWSSASLTPGIKRGARVPDAAGARPRGAVAPRHRHAATRPRATASRPPASSTAASSTRSSATTTTSSPARHGVGREAAGGRGSRVAPSPASPASRCGDRRRGLT